MRSATVLLALLFATCGQAQTGYLTYTAGVYPTAVTSADLNGDGKPDLAISNTGSDSLTILLNNGAGFTPLASVALAHSFAPKSILASDLNGDRKIDLLVAGFGGLVVLLGDGDATFQPAQSISGLPGGVISVQVADFDGDGVPDFAAAYLTGGFLIPTGAAFSIYKGKGDGTFVGGPSFSLGLTPWAILITGDFNHDGTPDIASAVGQNLIVFLNDGKANFTAIISGGEPWNFAPGIAAADFNGDGRLDLAITGQSVPQDVAMAGQGIIAVLLGKGDGTFQKLPSIPTPVIGQNVAAADLNGDGRVDLTVGLSTLVFFAGRGDGTFKSGIPFGASGNSGYFAIADFSGSGAVGFASTNDFQTAAGVQTTGNIVVLQRAVWPSLALANVSSGGYALGPLAPGSAATALGSGLATQTGAAANGMLPLLLGGDSVSVTGADGKALPAELYYVSPTQVNYVVPTGTATGLATVTITSNGSIAAQSQIDVQPVAPALFTVNSGNLAAAYVTRVDQNGKQTFQSVYQSDQNGNIVAQPIDLGSSTDTVYLSVFGTGIRNVTSPIAAIATLGGSTNVQISYLGPQGFFDGLDQVNLRLPRSLSSPTPYTTLLQLTVGGQPSNVVSLALQ